MTPKTQQYKVLITTSGTGSRLGKLTHKTNKALIKINSKEILAYIFDSYSEDIEIILTVGYQKEQIQIFVDRNYSNRRVTFVDIDKFEGPGSSLAYSMLKAKKYLQCPFIFHCNDTLVFESIPSPCEFNWNGGSKGNDPKLFSTLHYSSFKRTGGIMTSIQGKGATSFDYFHIGLTGVKDYNKYWHFLQQSYNENATDSSLNDVSAINRMLKSDLQFRVVEFKSWLDTGNLDGLNNAIKILEK